jgi:hypothetical protein
MFSAACSRIHDWCLEERIREEGHGGSASLQPASAASVTTPPRKSTLQQRLPAANRLPLTTPRPAWELISMVNVGHRLGLEAWGEHTRTIFLSLADGNLCNLVYDWRVKPRAEWEVACVTGRDRETANCGLRIVFVNRFSDLLVANLIILMKSEILKIGRNPFAFIIKYRLLIHTPFKKINIPCLLVVKCHDISIYSNLPKTFCLWHNQDYNNQRTCIKL